MVAEQGLLTDYRTQRNVPIFFSKTEVMVSIRTELSSSIRVWDHEGLPEVPYVVQRVRYVHHTLYHTLLTGLFSAPLFSLPKVSYFGSAPAHTSLDTSALRPNPVRAGRPNEPPSHRMLSLPWNPNRGLIRLIEASALA